MPSRPSNLIRLMLIAGSRREFRLAAEMAHEAGAEVVMAEDPQAALERLRRDAGDLVMLDVGLDAVGFLKQLRAERIAVPVLACGILAPAERAVAAIRAGALDYIPLPPEPALIAAAILSVGHRVSAPIGDDPALTRAIGYARAVAPSDASILIAGETGTGKEVMARMVHDASGRPGRFLVVECAGVAAGIMESELFGHDAGAFPGAIAQRAGRLAEAADGTVFLREIGALPPSIQARLATFLADGGAGISPGGGSRGLEARLIASTSRDLAAQVTDGTFRADLLSRLALVRIELPPLRERGDDIGRLAAHFAERLATANCLPRRPLSTDALERLRRHDWPGNVRELEDVIHRAVLLSQDPEIGSDALVLSDGSQILTAAAPDSVDAELQVGSLVGRSMADVERELILQTLKRCGGNRTTASTILGISVRTMRNKLKSFIEAGISISPAA